MKFTMSKQISHQQDRLSHWETNQEKKASIRTTAQEAASIVAAARKQGWSKKDLKVSNR